MSGPKARYADVGPVNPGRVRAALAELEKAVLDGGDAAPAATDALYAVEPDVPDLRLRHGDAVVTLPEARAMLADRPDPGLARDIAAALRRVLGHVPADAAPPPVVGTVGQLRGLLAGFPAEMPLDFRSTAGLPPGGRCRIGSVVRHGAKGSPHQGITIQQYDGN